jgi:chemotaxis signal transduction protein
MNRSSVKLKCAFKPAMNNHAESIESNSSTGNKRVRLFRRGSIDFGVSENEIATVAEWRALAPLPRAPESVLGIACIQGRMLTVLDVASLLAFKAASQSESAQQIAALRGDEQLALAVDSTGGTIEIRDEAIRKNEEKSALVNGVYEHENRQINILNVRELLRSSVLGRERRHRRF